MSRYRLYPTVEQEQLLTAYCSHARYVWNVALEQMNYGVRERRMPGWAEQSRQLTEARYEHDWLRDVPVEVGRMALRDFRQALQGWWSSGRGRPKWRKQGRHDGFRLCDRHGLRVEKLNRRWSQIRISGIGWVKFRRTREVPPAKSYRVTRDPSGRWHLAFAVKPDPVQGPGTGEVIGVDRGVTVTLAYSDGTMLHGPKPRSVKAEQRAMSRCKRGSNRRAKARRRFARTHGRNRNRRKDWIEKVTTDLARAADWIRIEDLPVQNLARSGRGTIEAPGRNVAAKAALNRTIKEQGWGMFARRLEDKAAGRVEKVNPAYTSQRCSRCGHVDRKSRESQARFRCTSCGFAANADVNAAINIAAGRAVRRAEQLAASKRVPQRSDPRVA